MSILHFLFLLDRNINLLIGLLYIIITKISTKVCVIICPIVIPCSLQLEGTETRWRLAWRSTYNPAKFQSIPSNIYIFSRKLLFLWSRYRCLSRRLTLVFFVWLILGVEVIGFRLDRIRTFLAAFVSEHNGILIQTDLLATLKLISRRGRTLRIILKVNFQSIFNIYVFILIKCQVN